MHTINITLQSRERYGQRCPIPAKDVTGMKAALDLAISFHQIRRSGLPLFKYVPKKAPRYKEKPHPTLPAQLFPSFYKPMRQHPKRTNTGDNVNDNRNAK